MHIQFKGLLMGWYHVNRIGKGICLGNVDEVHYNEDFIAMFTCSKCGAEVPAKYAYSV